MAYQSRDVLALMEKDAGVKLAALRVDGGASVNNALLQFQADLLDVQVRRPVVAETTALGAAYLAGLAVGYWRDLDDVAGNWALDREFTPQMDPARRQSLTRGWDRAVAAQPQLDRAVAALAAAGRSRRVACKNGGRRRSEGRGPDVPSPAAHPRPGSGCRPAARGRLLVRR